MPKRIDVSKIAAVIGTLYPEPFDQPCRARARQKLGSGLIDHSQKMTVAAI